MAYKDRKMSKKDENLFWIETPKTNRWKKVVTIVCSVFLIVLVSFGISSAKYGYRNISSLVLHGHFETVSDNKIKSVSDDLISDQNGSPPPTSSSTASPASDFNLSNKTSASPVNSTKLYGEESKSNYPNSGGINLDIPEYDKTGAVAICNDYTYSHEQHNSSTCSNHSGVMYWLDGSDTTPAQKKKVCVENTSMKQLLEQQYQNQVTSIKRQEENELGQARVDLANRGIDGASGAYLSTIQNIEDKYTTQLSNLKNEYDQKINAVEPTCHNE